MVLIQTVKSISNFEARFQEARNLILVLINFVLSFMKTRSVIPPAIYKFMTNTYKIKIINDITDLISKIVGNNHNN
jgi:hypothetical protein